MATTTTNFGWDIPQSTDLVKDGATAIAALGQDIDTALVDLKGGTTGQVLAKATGTDLDFSWATASGGDLTRITKVTFTASSAVNIDNCFSSAYDFYLIQAKITLGTINNYVQVRMRASGTNNTSSTYSNINTYVQYNGTGAGYEGNLSGTFAKLAFNDSTREFPLNLDVRSPFEAKYTYFTSLNPNDLYSQTWQGIHATATSYDGISIFPSAGTITGELNIYGYKKG
jgi:hypothetical protein